MKTQFDETPLSELGILRHRLCDEWERCKDCGAVECCPDHEGKFAAQDRLEYWDSEARYQEGMISRGLRNRDIAAETYNPLQGTKGFALSLPAHNERMRQAAEILLRHGSYPEELRTMYS